MITVWQVKSNTYRRIYLIIATLIALIFMPLFFMALFIVNLFEAITETGADICDTWKGLGSDWLKAWKGR